MSYLLDSIDPVSVQNNTNVKTYVAVITPAIATELLANHSTVNRKIQNNTVRKYAADMRNGKWQMNGEATLVFDKNGNMLNGYHRCIAAQQANTSFPTIVVEGVEPDVFITMDSGYNKTLASVFNLLGVKNPQVCSATVKKYFALVTQLNCMTAEGNTNFKHCSKTAIGNEAQFMYTIYKDNQASFDNIVEYVINLRRKRKLSFSSRLMTPGDVGGLISYLYINKGHSLSTILSFFDQLYGMTTDTVKPNVWVSHLKDVLNDWYELKETRPKPSTVQKTIAKAWNGYITNAKYSKKNASMRLKLTEKEISQTYIDFT